MRFAWCRDIAYQLFKSITNYAPDVVIKETINDHSELVAKYLFDSVPAYGLRQECYSQEGEDLALTRIFNAKRHGFFIDVGAHHPIRFSNTYLLYRMGWRGINIDATPGSMGEFRRVRPRDINIENLVSSGDKSQTFFLLNEPALNTSVSNLAHHRSKENPRYQVVNTIDLQPRTLASLLDEYLPPNQKIDLLTVDVEGLDLDVLQSNNWDRYRPAVILAELLPATESADDSRHAITQYLNSKGYRIRSRFFNTALFELIESNCEDAASRVVPNSNSRSATQTLAAVYERALLPAAHDRPVVFLINQISSHGHLDMYARLYSQCLLELGYRVVLIAEHEAAVATWLTNRGWKSGDFEILERRELANSQSNPSAVADDGGASPLLSRIVRVWNLEGMQGIAHRLGYRLYTFGYRYRGITRRILDYFGEAYISGNGASLMPIIAEINSAAERIGKEPSLVFFLYLDMISQSRLSCRNLTRLRAPWAGILFHPKCNGEAGGNAFERYFQSDNAVGAVFLNPHVVQAYQKRFPRQIFGALPDVTDTELAPIEPELVGQFRTRANGRKVVLALGSLSQHKGIVGLIDLIHYVDPNKFYFVIAGEIFWESFGSAEPKLRAFCENPPENCLVQLGYVNSEADLNAIIASADILYAVYQEFRDSSNSLTKASVFETPVLVSDGYLMGERVRTYRLGAAVKFGDVKSIEKGLLDISTRSSSEFGFAAYRRDSSYEALRDTFAHHVEAWIKAPRTHMPG